MSNRGLLYADFDPDTGEPTILKRDRSSPATLAGSGGAGGAPAVFATRALTDADNGRTLTLAAAATATIHLNAAAGFGCLLVGGPATVDGALGVTITDYRETGIATAAQHTCAIVQTAANSYHLYGGKA